MDTCEECSGQVAVIVDISKGIIAICPVCERNSKIMVHAQHNTDYMYCFGNS